MANVTPVSRRVSNIEALEGVARFLRSGEIRHLPVELRAEAEGIRSLVMAAALRGLAEGGMSPWPASAARPQPGPGASFGDVIRALTGDRADEDSGLTAGDEP